MSYPAFVIVSVAVALAMAGAAVLSRQRSVAITVAFAGATGLVLLAGLGYFRIFSDDAFITFRYADHLAAGAGPNWNSDGRVEGYTNFSWMLVMAGFAKLGADLVIASQVLGGLAAIATLWVVLLLWRRWSREDPEAGIEHPGVIAAALGGLALTGAVPFWAFSGMETALFTLLLTVGAYAFLVERRSDTSIPWSAVALAGAALTRPEGLIAVAVTGAFVLAGALDVRRGTLDLRRPLLWGAAFAVIYVPYFAWRYAYYDQLLPNTFYAKTEPNRLVFDRGLEYVWTYGTRYLLPALFVGIAFLATRPRLRFETTYVVALVVAMLAGIVFVGGENFPHGRFIVPVLPLTYLAGIAGLAVALKRLALPRPAPALIASLALTLAALSVLRASSEGATAIARERDAMGEREALGRWISEHVRQDYTVAAFAVGAIGYYTEQDILDMLGLNDTVIAHTDVPGLGAGLGGHEKYNIDYVLDTVRPEIIVISDGEPQAYTEEEVRQRMMGGSRVPARDRLFADPRLWERYDVRSIEIDGVWFNFLQRADTIPSAAAPALRLPR